MRRLLTALAVVAIVAASCGDTVSEEVTTPVGETNTSASTAADDEAAVTSGEPEATPSESSEATEPPSETTSPEATEPPVTTDETKPPPTTTAPLTDPPATVEEPVAAQGMVDIAKADLATRLGVAMSDIGVVSIEEVTWRDGSLGCPRPGFSYTQALVNGTRILLTANGVTYHYHSGGGDPFYCANPQDPLPPGGGDYGDV